MALNLGKQIGPLPAGAWIGVVGGGLMLAYFINKRQAAGDTETPTLTDPDSDVGVGGGQFQYEPIQTVQPEPATPEDNVAWGRKAVAYLISSGYTPTVAQNTISKFLSAEPLTANEKLIVDAALLRFGPPPEPIAPTDDTPTPPSTPKPPAVPLPGAKNLAARPLRRAVNFTWTYSGPPIGGFAMTIKDLRSGRIIVTKNLPAKSRAYRWTAPPTWNARNKGKVQIWIRPFQGGWAQPNKKYGPGAGASALPII